MKFLLAGIACSLSVGTAWLSAAVDDARAAENLEIFARVYGYVRFFSPSDAVANADWDKVAILGVQTARDARSHAELRQMLNEFFQPIAPGFEVTAEPRAPETAASSGQKMIFWQYAGLNLTGEPGPYRRKRVIIGDTGELSPLFPAESAPGPIDVTLASDLALHLPSALPLDDRGLTPTVPESILSAVRARFSALDVDALTAADWRLRAAGVSVVWNVFQHFQPYLDVAAVPWAEALRPSIARALRDPDGSDYYATLAELIARTKDGHGIIYIKRDGRIIVYNMRDGFGGLPMRVAVCEGRVVVTGVGDEVPLTRGDIVLSIDGVDALEALARLEHLTPGSPHLSRFRALNQFGQGPEQVPANLAIEREGERRDIVLKRSRNHTGYCFSTLSDLVFPSFAEVRPGIFYINLASLPVSQFAEKLPVLAKARGVIFDQRFDCRFVDRPENEFLEVYLHVIPHLIASTIQASPMRVPQISRPDRAGWTFDEHTWPVEPQAPRLGGKIVFIDDPAVVSSGETSMAMISHYGLASLVGDSTAGTNGNVSFIPIPGKINVMWTAMEVLTHDRTQFYGVGFRPDYPVQRTLKAVREGRDEYLEKAIEVIESAQALRRPKG